MSERGMTTVDDLAELDQELRYELINGHLHMLTMTMLHQDTCRKVVNALRPAGRDWAMFLPVYGMSLEVDRYNEPRADAVVAPVRHFNSTTVPARDLLLAAEVLWPDSADRDRSEKADIYARAGVPAYCS